MKTIKYIAAVIMAAFTMNASAQMIMRIEFQGGKQMDMQVSDVANITWFENNGGGTIPDNTPSGVEAVDLGLPSGIKWANMNIGATSREDYGDYFAWGETSGYKSGKTDFSKSTYKWYMSTTTTTTDEYGYEISETISGYTKYVSKSNTYVNGYNGYDGFYDDKYVLDPEDDAAHMNWGGSWRMPTKAECRELLNYCTLTYVSLNGVGGYKVTGPNGNHIFMPNAGYRTHQLHEANYAGYYWSSSLPESGACNAEEFFINPDHYPNYGSNNRENGLSIRAVCP